MGRVGPGNVRSTQPSLGPLVVVEHLGKDTVEVAGYHGNEVSWVQQVGLIPARVFRSVPAKIRPLLVRNGREHPLFPPIVWKGGDQSLLDNLPHPVGVELEALG